MAAAPLRSADGSVRHLLPTPGEASGTHCLLIFDQAHQDRLPLPIMYDDFAARRFARSFPLAAIGDRRPFNADNGSRLNRGSSRVGHSRASVSNEQKHRSVLGMHSPTRSLSLAPEWMSSRPIISKMVTDALAAPCDFTLFWTDFDPQFSSAGPTALPRIIESRWALTALLREFVPREDKTS